MILSILTVSRIHNNRAPGTMVSTLTGRELILLSRICRRGFGVWEFGVQHLWVCSHAAGEHQVQDDGEEGPARAYLLRHPLHADHRGPGECAARQRTLHIPALGFPLTSFSLRQIKAWTANPQQFVEDEDDDTFSYSVRISAQDLLLVRRRPLVSNMC